MWSLLCDNYTLDIVRTNAFIIRINLIFLQADDYLFTKPCFLDTIPVLCVLAYSMVVCIPYMLVVANCKKPWNGRRNNLKNQLQIVKLVFSLLYLALFLAESLYAVKTLFDLTHSVFDHSVFRLAASMISGSIVVATMLTEMKMVVLLSPCLFFYWLLAMVTAAQRLSAGILTKSYENQSGLVDFCCTVVAVLICLIQTIVYGFLGPYVGIATKKVEENDVVLPLSSASEEPILESEPCPEEKASVVSRLSYSWLTGFIFRGWRHAIKPAEIFGLLFSETAPVLSRKFQKNWLSITKPIEIEDQESDEEVDNVDFSGVGFVDPSVGNRNRPGLTVFKAAMKAFGSDIALSAFIKLLQDISILLCPILLLQMADYLKNSDSRPKWHGIVITIGIFTVMISQAVCLQRVWYYMAKFAVKLRGAFSTAIFKKSLRLSGSSKSRKTSGEIVNLIASDSTNLLQMTIFL